LSTDIPESTETLSGAVPFPLYVPPVLLDGDRPAARREVAQNIEDESLGVTAETRSDREPLSPDGGIINLVLNDLDPIGVVAPRPILEPVFRTEPARLIQPPTLPGPLREFERAVNRDWSETENLGSEHSANSGNRPSVAEQRWHLEAKMPVAPDRAFFCDPEDKPAAPSGHLWLHIRDPQSLYACWSFGTGELTRYSEPRGGVWQIRLYAPDRSAEPWVIAPLPMESDHLFLESRSPGTRFIAMMGMIDNRGNWERFAESQAVVSPAAPETPRICETAVVAELGVPQSPPSPGIEMKETPVAGLSNSATVRLWQLAWAELSRRTASSGEVVSMFPKVERGEEWLVGPELPQASVGASENVQAASGINLGTVPGSIPPLAAPPQASTRSFWLRVNAELIVYGSTEKDAVVTIGDRKIRLREDGSFSFRFALPDGNYPLPVAAVSADGVDTRTADLAFTRSTSFSGEVGIHPPEIIRRPPVWTAVS
jgi:hypothetical protein